MCDISDREETYCLSRIRGFPPTVFCVVFCGLALFLTRSRTKVIFAAAYSSSDVLFTSATMRIGKVTILLFTVFEDHCSTNFDVNIGVA